jgi:predicted murein hydrolase (TIGR00659 family)
MAEFAATAAAAVGVTLLVYTVSRKLYTRLGYVILNPVLVSIVVLIALLETLGIEYATYDWGGRLIEFFLEPAVVALGVPLFRQMERIARQKKAIILSILAGAAVGIGSASITAVLLGAPPEVVFSLAPRSVTTPIAIGIAEEIGGIPSLSAAIVIATGVLGAVLGPVTLRLLGVRSRTAFGLAIGAAAHGIGTARAVEEGEVEGASGALAIGLMGIATAFLAPPLMALLMWIWGSS